MKKYGANQGELRSGTFYPTGTYAFSPPDRDRAVQVQVLGHRPEG